MSEVITGLLKLAFSFIRTQAAKKLEDGGLTDQKFRGWIARELDDIKSKLDAISRKDLCTSISCLEQGIDRLSMSGGKSSESGNLSACEFSNGKAKSLKTKPTQIKDAVALANAVAKLKIEPNKLFELAKESFKEAGKEARRAFHNAALSTEERILASKVRIASGILQHLDNPEVAASDCLRYLEELNDMPAIQEIFSVHIKVGLSSWIKSGFKKDSRAEIVETVTMINLILADFITRFSKRRMAVFDWPMIKCGTRIVHPIHYKKESLPNLKEMKITPPWDIVVFEEKIWYSTHRALTKNGDLVCSTVHGANLQKLEKTTGKLQPYCAKHSQPRGKVVDIAVDEDDTVYVLSGDYWGGFTLSVYSADGRNTHHCPLKFLKESRGDIIVTVTNNDKTIVISCKHHGGNIMVYLCNRDGKLINSFDTGLTTSDHYIKSSSVSRNNEIILVTIKFARAEIFKDSLMLYIYKEDGNLQNTVTFQPSEGEASYIRIVHNQVTMNIIRQVWDYDDDKILIEYFSDQTAERRCSYLLYDTNFPGRIGYHPLFYHTNGALALVGDKQVIFLQKSST